MRSVATGALAKNIFLSGDLDRARQVYEQALEIGHSANNVEMIINTSDDIADILIEQGKLRQAERMLSETLPLTLRPDGQRLPISARIYAGLGKVSYEWNQLDLAEQRARLCLDVSQQWGNIEMQASAYILLGRVEQARGNLDKAQALMRTADQLDHDHQLYPWNAIRLEAAVDRFWLSTGSLDRVSARLQASKIHPGDEITFFDELKYLTLLRWLLAGAEYLPALGLAQRLAQKAEAGERRLRLVELLVLQSLAHLGMKDLQAAVATLARAVALAEPEGYRRVFLDEGEALVRLLYLVKSGRDSTGFAQQLLKEFGQAATPAPVLPQLLVEPLSGREIEVLKLIESGLSNQEIASRLYLSITTVKRHISNIYAKLDVKNRTQAVGRGKEIGILGT
jgi:LuxR family maltose regulon positive regulatory protein